MLSVDQDLNFMFKPAFLLIILCIKIRFFLVDGCAGIAEVAGANSVKDKTNF